MMSPLDQIARIADTITDVQRDNTLLIDGQIYQLKDNQHNKIDISTFTKTVSKISSVTDFILALTTDLELLYIKFVDSRFWIFVIDTDVVDICTGGNQFCFDNGKNLYYCSHLQLFDLESKTNENILEDIWEQIEEIEIPADREIVSLSLGFTHGSVIVTEKVSKETSLFTFGNNTNRQCAHPHLPCVPIRTPFNVTARYRLPASKSVGCTLDGTYFTTVTNEFYRIGGGFGNHAPTIVALFINNPDKVFTSKESNAIIITRTTKGAIALGSNPHANTGSKRVSKTNSEAFLTPRPILENYKVESVSMNKIVTFAKVLRPTFKTPTIHSYLTASKLVDVSIICRDDTFIDKRDVDWEVWKRVQREKALAEREESEVDEFDTDSRRKSRE
jgi:hypothetical protein